MDSTIKGIGTKLTEEEQSIHQKDMTNELANLNQITEQKQQTVIILHEKDIELLKSELEITYEEAKLSLIKHKGDLKQTIESFLLQVNCES